MLVMFDSTLNWYIYKIGLISVPDKLNYLDWVIEMRANLMLRNEDFHLK